MDRIAIAVISAVLLVLLTFCNNTMPSTAYAITYDKGGMPMSLSGDEFVIVRDTALSDPRVQELIGGRNYAISDCCGFVQIGGPSASWQPVMNIRVANELQIAVSVDLDARKVTGIESGPVIQHQVPHDETTAAEQLVKDSSSDNNGKTSVSFLATNTTTVLPLILITGIILGGAATGMFYFLKKRGSHLDSKEKA